MFLFSSVFPWAAFSLDGKPPVVQRATKETTLTGYTRSETTVAISSEVAGRVLAVNYEVGDTVGEKPVVEVDPTFVDFEIQGARRSLELLENSRDKAEKRLKYLEKEFHRIEALHKGDRATEVRRDAAEQDYIQAKLELDAVAIEKRKLANTLDELLERKRRHKIFAPRQWIVVEKLVEAGEQVFSGAPVAKVSDYRTLAVPLSVSGEELEEIRKLGDEFSAFLEQKPITAALGWINPEFDEKTRKLAVEISIVQYTGEKRGGLRFSLPLKIPSTGLQVPKSAVVSRYENPRVTVKASGEKINVLVLGETDGYLLIAEDPGLTPGTELLLPNSR